MRGRKPKPTELKLLSGNPGKRRINYDEPKFELGLGDPPDWLDDGAREVWFATVPELNAKSIVATVETQVFACYCQAVSRLRAAEELIARDGLTVPGSRGPMKHPAVNIAKDCAQLIRGFASEFGLTPASRSRIIVPRGGAGSNEFREI